MNLGENFDERPEIRNNQGPKEPSTRDMFINELLPSSEGSNEPSRDKPSEEKPVSEEKPAPSLDFRQSVGAPETRKDAEPESLAEKPRTIEASEDFDKMSPLEHLSAFRDHMENVLKLYNKLPSEWQNAVSGWNFESGMIKAADLADPGKVRGLMNSLERAVKDAG